VTVINFLDRHKEKAISEICDRLNIEWEEYGESSPAWDRAVRKYAEWIYRDRMNERRKKA
jgi:hypothetical protein